MDEIKKVAEEFRQQNGNKNYPVEDLIIYALHKLDKLPCSSHIRVMEGNKIRSKMLMWINGIEMGIISTLFVLILNKII